jgi:hypothetical protein
VQYRFASHDASEMALLTTKNRHQFAIKNYGIWARSQPLWISTPAFHFVRTDWCLSFGTWTRTRIS